MALTEMEIRNAKLLFGFNVNTAPVPLKTSPAPLAVASPTPLPPSPPTTFGKPSVGAGEWGGRDKPKAPTPKSIFPLDDDITF